MSTCRVNYVRKALKDQGKCETCGKELPAGSAYTWWSSRFTPKHVRCAGSGCAPLPWDLETNPLRADHMRAEGAVDLLADLLDPSEANDELRSAIELIEGIKDQLDDRVSGWEGTNLESSGQHEACSATRDELENWLSDAEAISGDLERMAEDWEGTEAENEDLADKIAELNELPELDLGA